MGRQKSGSGKYGDMFTYNLLGLVAKNQFSALVPATDDAV
jgi:hypothetical protein